MSVIITAIRWDAHLDRAVASIAAQRLPVDVGVEIAVALAEPESAGSRRDVLVMDNPGGSIPAGLNRAASMTRGEILVRVDSRCHLQPDHVSRMVAGLRDTRVGSVGGAQLVTDRGLLGSAYAVAFNSPMLGPSRYRFSRTSGPTDSPYLGAWRRDTFEALGGFDERWLRNQDNDLAERVQAEGLEVRYDADAVVGYVAGRSLLGMLRHHYSFGWWRMAQRKQGGQGLAPRHVIVVGVMAVGAGTGLAALLRPRTRRWAVALGITAYGGAVAGAWTTAARLRMARPDLELAPFHPVGVIAAPALAAVIDAGWLLGLVRGRRVAGGRQPIENHSGVRSDPG